ASDIRRSGGQSQLAGEQACLHPNRLICVRPRATAHRAPRTGEEHLLTGLTTLLTVRYCAAAPLLRQAIDALAAEPGPSERVPVWLLAITFAAEAIWEDRSAPAWVARCEDLARPADPATWSGPHSRPRPSSTLATGNTPKPTRQPPRCAVRTPS